MNAFYTMATDVADGAQPILDGGLFSFILENYVRISDFHSNGSESEDRSYSSHFVSTVSSGGFFAGIFFCVVWCIGLLTGFSIIWWFRYRKTASGRAPSIFVYKYRTAAHETKTYASPALKRPSVDIPNPTSGSNSFNGLRPKPATKSVFFMTRRRLQSNWMCLAAQFTGIFILVFLIFITAVLGVITSSSLHSNLVTEGSINSPILPDNGGFRLQKVFPATTTALASIRAYLENFINSTRSTTLPTVYQLMEDTEDMQNKTAAKFNDLLFDQLGVQKAFELGEKLGDHTVRLMQLALPLKKHVQEYVDAVSDLSLTIARWTGYMEQLTTEQGPHACQTERNCNSTEWYLSDLSVRSDWRLNQFDFAIALDFVAGVQNKTPESIAAELTRSQSLAAQNLAKTMEQMSVELNIPDTIRNLTESQWEHLTVHIDGVLEMLNETAETVVTQAFETSVFASNRLLAVGCVLWLSTTLVALGIIWLLCQFHCVSVDISSRGRRKVRCAISVAFLFLILAVLFSCAFFLAGGYAHTEICRYIKPDHAATVVIAEPILQEGAPRSLSSRVHFALDVHLNSFLDRNWQQITDMAAEIQSKTGGEVLPLPRIRSPIKALSVGCRDNLGVLDAFDAIDTFDFSMLNKPALTARFIEVGKRVMRQSINELNATEMFPSSLMESLQMAARLDDFLIPFEDVRASLPRDFLNITKTENGNLTTALLSGEQVAVIWNDRLVRLNQSSYAADVIARADELAHRVFNQSAKVTTLLNLIDKSLQELGKLKRIGPTVSALQKQVDNLVSQMNDKPGLIAMAMDLFDDSIARNLPAQADVLIRSRGPSLVREIGRCRRLHDAYLAVTSAVCEGVVGPLNGIWFFSGLCVFMITIALLLGLSLLLHKLPVFPELESEKQQQPSPTHGKQSAADSDTVASCAPAFPSPTLLNAPNGGCIVTQVSDSTHSPEAEHRYLLKTAASS
uniref:Prominin-1-A n=1 Tax=Schistocephalus solidus TaxID=70667 RepID=A0A0X3NXX4_SCHSO